MNNSQVKYLMVIFPKLQYVCTLLHELKKDFIRLVSMMNYISKVTPTNNMYTYQVPGQKQFYKISCTYVV